MSKFILSAIAALAILGGISSASIAAPRDHGTSTGSEQDGGSFPANFWDELNERAAG